MKTKLFGSLLILVLLFVGCSDDSSVTDPTGTDGPSGTFTLSGDVSGTFDAELGYVNSGDYVGISISDKEGNIGILLGSSLVRTGTFSIPEEYVITYINTQDTIMTELHAGSVKIDEISGTSVSGSFSGSGYPLDMSTYTIDSTRIINISAAFSL